MKNHLRWTSHVGWLLFGTHTWRVSCLAGCWLSCKYQWQHSVISDVIVPLLSAGGDDSILLQLLDHLNHFSLIFYLAPSPGSVTPVSASGSPGIVCSLAFNPKTAVSLHWVSSTPQRKISSNKLNWKSNHSGPGMFRCLHTRLVGSSHRVPIRSKRKCVPPTLPSLPLLIIS